MRDSSIQEMREIKVLIKYARLDEQWAELKELQEDLRAMEADAAWYKS